MGRAIKKFQKDNYTNALILRGDLPDGDRSICTGPTSFTFVRFVVIR